MTLCCYVSRFFACTGNLAAANGSNRFLSTCSIFSTTYTILLASKRVSDRRTTGTRNLVSMLTGQRVKSNLPYR